MLRWSALAPLALAFVLVPAASAFESLPGGPHDDVTAAAAREAGFPESAVDALVEAVRAVDLRDNKLEPRTDEVDRIDATADYRPEHHCDRVAPTSHADSFNATVSYIADRKAAAVAAAQADDAEGAVDRLGELLHAVEDCFSHSNAVDLADPQAMVQYVNGRAATPEGLRLTGFQPGGEDTERPEGDPYPHGDFAKDSADKNDESKGVLADGHTKFEASRTLATEAAVLALQEVLSQLGPEELQALADVKDGGQPLPRVDISTLPAVIVLTAVVGLAAVTRRR